MRTGRVEAIACEDDLAIDIDWKSDIDPAETDTDTERSHIRPAEQRSQIFEVPFR